MRRLNDVTAEYMIRGHAAPIERALLESRYQLHAIVGPTTQTEERAVARLPAVTLAMGHIVWVPQAGALLVLRRADAPWAVVHQ